MDDVDLVAPEEIDESFVARPVDGAVEIEVGAELVVVGGPTRATVLNATGALVWRCLDGESSLHDLIVDLSDELGIDEDLVRADVLVFARVLGDAGLLAGVGPAPLEEPDWDDIVEWEPPAMLEVGDVLDDFTLPDLDGRERSLSELRGREVLLVNWSPGCGFCVNIAGQLARAEPVLAGKGVDLVFVTRGDVAGNRAVFDAAGITAPALVLDADVDPFSRAGTPAAYHLDADAKLVDPMVVGAFAVPALAAELAGVTVETLTGVTGTGPDSGDGDDAAPEGVRYLPAPGGT